MAKTYTYSAKQVIVALGSHAVTGFADDSFVTIEKNGDGITKTVGCDGEIVRSIDPDNTYKVKISLLQPSPTNAFLQNKFAQDYQTGDGTYPILIKDLKGGMIFSADTAWASKPATRTFGKSNNNREWELDTGDGTLKG